MRLKKARLNEPCFFSIETTLLPVERRVGEVDIFLIHLGLGQFEGLAEALEVDDLPLPQEADHVVHIRVITETQDIVIGEAGFLLCCNGVRATFLEAVIFIVQTAFK